MLSCYPPNDFVNIVGDGEPDNISRANVPYDGGTITVSNLGAWGIESFDAIVNPPQSLIVSVGAAVEKPVVRNGELTVGHEMTATLSSDHRVIDGADGARFLRWVCDALENPLQLVMKG